MPKNGFEICAEYSSWLNYNLSDHDTPSNRQNNKASEQPGRLFNAETIKPGRLAGFNHVLQLVECPALAGCFYVVQTTVKRIKPGCKSGFNFER